MSSKPEPFTLPAFVTRSTLTKEWFDVREIKELEDDLDGNRFSSSTESPLLGFDTCMGYGCNVLSLFVFPSFLICISR